MAHLPIVSGLIQTSTAPDPSSPSEYPLPKTIDPLHHRAPPEPPKMLPQRQIMRAAPRFLRSPAVQRRFMSSPAPKAGENAFVKERQAVKEHAAGTTGESFQRPEEDERRPIGSYRSS